MEYTYSTVHVDVRYKVKLKVEVIEGEGYKEEQML